MLTIMQFPLNFTIYTFLLQLCNPLDVSSVIL
jgi:hypothetical protein